MIIQRCTTAVYDPERAVIIFREQHLLFVSAHLAVLISICHIGEFAQSVRISAENRIKISIKIMEMQIRRVWRLVQYFCPALQLHVRFGIRYGGLLFPARRGRERREIFLFGTHKRAADDYLRTCCISSLWVIASNRGSF